MRVVRCQPWRAIRAPASEPLLVVPLLVPVLPPCLRGIEVVGGVIVGTFATEVAVRAAGPLIIVRTGVDGADVVGAVAIWLVITGAG